MKQSRLENFFSSSSSTTSSSSSVKRVATNDDETKETFKRVKSDENKHFSLNQFYLEKFLLILSSLLKHHRNLFEINELNLIEKFPNLSISSQIIFIRLLMRQCKWLRRSTINYEIVDVTNQTDCLTSLVDNGFLQDISTLDDLEIGLRLLTSEEMRDFSKRFHCQSKSNQSKKISIENLKNLTNQYKSIFGSTTTNRDHLLLKELKRILQNCYKISENVRSLFFRMMLVYHPIALVDMDDLDQNAFSILYKLLQITRGERRLPWTDDQINHEYLPFKTSDHLKSYQQAIDLQNEYYQLEQSKNMENLLLFYEKYNQQWRDLIDSTEKSEQLTGCFRRFSPDYVRFRILSSLTEILQRAGRYDEAVELLQYLLDRPIYRQHRRGKLWNRLALIQEKYIKTTGGAQQCLDTIQQALQDSSVELGDRLSLCERARKLLVRKKFQGQLEANWIDDENLMKISMPKEIEIIGRLISNDNRMGKVTYTIQDTIDGSIQFCTVEQLAIHHYRTKQDYTFGIHSEGSIMRTLIGVLFLDLIYFLPRSDLLIDIFQTEPLDFPSEHFYQSRKDLIDQRIEQLTCEENIENLAEKNWEMFNLIMSSVVNWDLFQTKSTFLDALKCLTCQQIQSLAIYIFVENRAQWKGFPDLFLWNPLTKKCKFVEVKSHNDRLSFHQIVWLDKLVEFEIDCEVCKVHANGTKK